MTLVRLEGFFLKNVDFEGEKSADEKTKKIMKTSPACKEIRKVFKIISKKRKSLNLIHERRHFSQSLSDNDVSINSLVAT